MTIDRDTYDAEKITPSSVLEIAPSAKVWWQQPAQIWNNLSIRAKITTLLVAGAAIPVIAVTQGIVGMSRQSALDDLRSLLKTELLLLEKSVQSETRQIADSSNILAQSAIAAGINPDDPATAAQQAKLTSFIQTAKALKPNASFYLITNSKGQTIAQSVQTVRAETSKYSPLPTAKIAPTQFIPVATQPGIELGDIAIVQAALKNARHLSGIELLKSPSLQKLGLAKQADIGLRTQATAGLSTAKKPYPEGTFDVDSGKIGFVLMSVQPIQLNGKQVGTAIVGTLVNRNYDLVDRLRSETGVSTATLFAQDWRVSTNVPYADKATRATGTRVSSAVADKVLNQGKVFVGDANIIGVDYMTSYAPLYDHRQQLDPKTAKPIGIAYVGEPQTQVDRNLQQITLSGYGIGGGILLVAILILSPLHRSISRPIRRLTEFADRIAAGQFGVRLEEDLRQDEIGVLTHNLNQMAQQIDVNLDARQQEVEQQRQQRELLEEGILNLVNEIEGATNGDLTVRASLDSLELSTVADLFNAVIDSLRDIAIEVKQGTGQVTTSLGSNERDIRELSEQAITEAAEIRGTFNSVEQMTDSIQTVATNANQASTIAKEAYVVAQEGTEAMAQTVDSILSLRTTVGESAKKMKRLGESSQKISQVVTLIEEIALKTNLLAINASVEASRAGEQGRGFTVVAEQVGALAEQSAVATREIAQIVAAIQAETQDVAQVMELGTAQVVDGTRLVEATKQKLNQMLQKSQEIDILMSSISTATISQAETAKVVTQLIQQVTVSSEERSTFSSQMAASMQSTSQVAKQLEEKVAQFQV
ncbi:methyl-accepting chemotaxis protein [Chamaesiphon sp. OTE_75_metabat_556]|uniref:methyl-accepting chemotaxis protein n=1 Tax=Chamaesiphon sp. OTE_75_metabat_556 TaxID=2964692 RepID=UPI00286BF1DF|nr:methyl-accepting chemotaxis protein [Chamaesiphon sp. OTE_75_metabat_556]